jgi:hypothetical protein
MINLFNRVINTCKWLVNVRKPRLQALDYIDLLLEHQLLLLVSWQVEDARNIKIVPGKARYHQASGAALCKLPAGTKKVEVVVSNIWRKTRYPLALTQVQVEPGWVEAIEALLRPNGILLSDWKATPACAPILLSTFRASLHMPLLETMPIIIINHQPLNDYAP